MKKKMVEYLRNFLIQNDWCEEYTKRQARAIFTTICLFFDIDADTDECDNILSYVYDVANIADVSDFDDLAKYDDFKNYMLELIV